MTKYGRSPWVESFPKSRVPAYPRQRGAEPEPGRHRRRRPDRLRDRVRVCRGRRQRVVLLEAERIGRGSTGRQPRVDRRRPGRPVRGGREGRRPKAGARRRFTAWRRAALDFAALLRRLDIKCALAGARAPQPWPSRRSRWRGSSASRRRGATPASRRRCSPPRRSRPSSRSTRWRPSGTRAAPCSIRTARASAWPPPRPQRGAPIFERSPVRQITFDRRHADVFTAGGAIRADARGRRDRRADAAVQVARAALLVPRPRIFALTERVPAKIRQQLGPPHHGRRATPRQPPHIVRWVDDERLLVAGADAAVAARARAATSSSCSAPGS